MSSEAQKYQEFATGYSADYAYVVSKNGQSVKFDGYDTASGKLIDAKGPYSQFVVKKDGEFVFQDWYSGADGLVEQAERQLKVANGAPVEWRVRDREVVLALRQKFADNDIQGINVVHYPMP